MSLCHSEAVAYTEYVPNLAADGKPGTLTKADVLMLVNSYADDSESSGAYTLDLICFSNVMHGKESRDGVSKS